jgi:hypothetical protein
VAIGTVQPRPREHIHIGRRYAGHADEERKAGTMTKRTGTT